MSKNPSLIAFMGDDTYRRLKNMNKLLSGLSLDGWDVVHVDMGKDLAPGWEQLASHESSGVFFKKKTAYVLHTERVGDGMHRMKGSDGVVSRKIHDRVLAQVKKPDPDLLFVVDTSKKPSTNRTQGFLDEPIGKIQSRWRMVWKMPPFYKLDERAVKMCDEAAREYGKIISTKVAQTIVQVVGNDLGVVENEIRKYAIYANYLGDGAIEVKHVKGLIAQIGEVKMDPFLGSVASANVRKAAQYLGWIKNTHGQDPTMKTCLYLSNTATKWYLAASTHEKGIKPDVAAANQEVNPWYYKNKILPPARRWGAQNLRSLLCGLARVERSVLEGRLNPWHLLERQILRSCRDVSRG